MYNVMASQYEKTAAFQNQPEISEVFTSILAEHSLKPPGNLGDFGCGTGLNSIPFAEAGWDVYGIELSKAMLIEADKKIRALPQEIQSQLHFSQGDITQKCLPEGLELDAAVCLCNTLNHLIEASDLEAFLNSAFSVLKAGGILILDTDTLETFQAYFDHGPVAVWDDGKQKITRSCKFNTETGRANHTTKVFQYGHSGPKEIKQEPMALQYYSEDKLREAFQAAGFSIEKELPFNPFPTLYTRDFNPKILWVLKKQN